MPEGIDLGLSGLASGFDWRTLVDQLTEVERSPQRRLLTEQNLIDQRKNSYASIATQLGVLRNRVEALKDSSLFGSRTAATSDSTIATATAAAGTPLGSYAIRINQLATAASLRGPTNAGSSLSLTNDVSGLALKDAAFATTVTAGTFTVNGKEVIIATTDTLQSVFNKIGTATSGDVTGSYDASTDKITLTSGAGAPIVFGRATDTSNFLDAAQLFNNGSSTTTSASALGVVLTSALLSSSNLAVAMNDGGSGAGLFKINGVEISFDASEDSIDNVLQRINESAAGVFASYDRINDRFVLSNKATGDTGVTVEDVTGNFVTATGLSGGSLERGKDLLYTINGGGTLRSRSNSITQTSSGLAGLAVMALQENATVTIGVTADTAKIKTAITDFIAEFNKVQSLIDTNTASTTDPKGKVTAGTLSGETDANRIASALRGLVNATLSGLSGSFTRLENIGVTSSGYDDNLTLSDSEALDDALANRLSSVQELFSHTKNGLAARLDEYLEGTIGDEGSLVDKQDVLAKQSVSIETQLVEQERQVQSRRQQMIASFVSMEQAQLRINQQLQFLTQRFGTSSAAA